MTTTTEAVSPEASRAIMVPWERIDRFLGQLTHDVRNGLNALELQLTFLGEISTDPEALGEVKRLRQTVSDITRQLQAVRMASGAVTLNTLDYPAREFFEDLQERFERKEPASKDRVNWKIDVGEGLLAIDPEASMASFVELIANALLFSERTSPVSLAATMTANEAEVALAGTCSEPPLVAPEEWGKTPLLSTRRGAYGLGLFHAKRMIEAQGGMLNATYSAADRTLTTVVTLPTPRLP